MDIAIINGNIALDESGRPRSIDGIEKALQQVRMCLEIRKGSFVFLPSLGSELWRLDSSKPYLQKQADMFVREALVNLKSITVKSVTAVSAGGGVSITVDIEKDGKSGRLEMNVNGTV